MRDFLLEFVRHIVKKEEITDRCRKWGVHGFQTVLDCRPGLDFRPVSTGRRAMPSVPKEGSCSAWAFGGIEETGDFPGAIVQVSPNAFNEARTCIVGKKETSEEFSAFLGL
jgi:hypothetical protein